MKLFFSITTLLLFLFAASLAANAQFDQSVTITLTPSSPHVGDTVTAHAVLSGGDPSQLDFQWLLNGKSVTASSGKGKNEFTFTLGAASRTVVDVTATASDGTSFSDTKAITTGQPLIVWWTDTSVPIWYQGKAMPSPGSTVTILAMPGLGFGENPSNLMYSWSINVEPHPEISGFGRNSFQLKMSLAQNVIQQIDVHISNSSQTIAQDATLLLPARSPETLIYSMLPTGGVNFAKALSLFAGDSGETYDFIAEPFFFRSDQLQKLTYAWSVNNQTIEGSFTKPRVLTLKTNPGGPSENTVGVNVKGISPDTQETNTSFIANFR